MLETITYARTERDYARTLIIDDREAKIGGAVCNAAWYLSQLGLSPKVISHSAHNDKEEVLSFFRSLLVSPHVAFKQTVTDRLVVAPRIQMPSLYFRGKVDTDVLRRQADSVEDGETLFFTGSRHQELRDLALDLLKQRSKIYYVFSPSYTIYDFEKAELMDHIINSDVFIINNDEAAYISSLFKPIDLEVVMRLPRAGGIVTKGFKGADLYERNSYVLHVVSCSNSEEDVLGAGEAFLCGFLFGLRQNPSWPRAGKIGALIASQVVRTGAIRTTLDMSEIRNQFA